MNGKSESKNSLKLLNQLNCFHKVFKNVREYIRMEIRATKELEIT